MKRLLFFIEELFYKYILKPILFIFDPELMHDFYTWLGNLLGKSAFTKIITKFLFHYENKRVLSQTIDGVSFDNPVGLAAGFDKDANLIQILNDVGFGFMQVGSITHKPYQGNPQPRLYRLPKSKGLVVYYGLKNLGSKILVEKIKKQKRQNFPLSVSVAKTNSDATATDEGGIKDYLATIELFEKNNVGDFYTINISCPNAFGGEPFTSISKLSKLLSEIDLLKIKKPVYIKMPINYEWKKFNELLKVIVKHNIQGVIIGNLTKERSASEIKDKIPEKIAGGISGKPCEPWIKDLIEKTYKTYGKKLTIVGVGGIFNSEDAYDLIKRGASLVQLITGMIYKGPQTIGQINAGLAKRIKDDGYENISEAVGAYYK